MSTMRLALLGGPQAVPKGSLAPRWPTADESEEEQLREVLRDDVWGATGMGPKIAEFNRVWADYCDTRRSVALANGTVTIELAVRAFGIGPGDEVIVPAWTFIATAAAVLNVGATPVFVDVEPRHLCIAPDAVEAAVSERTRGIVPVHLAGHPCDMDTLVEISARCGLALIEDAAQAHGAIWRGKKMGSFGDAGSYSFQQSKNLQCGEGGSVVTNDEELADRLHYSLSKFGRGVGREYEPYIHHELAGNASMTEFQAAVLLAQFARFEEQAVRRAAAAAFLTTLLLRIDGITPLAVDSRVDRHGCHLFLSHYDTASFDGLPRDEFIRALDAEGVPCFSIYPGPLFRQPMFDLGRSTVRGTRQRIVTHDCPETISAAQTTVAFPQTMLLVDHDALSAVPQAIEKVRHGAIGLMRT